MNKGMVGVLQIDLCGCLLVGMLYKKVVVFHDRRDITKAATGRRLPFPTHDQLELRLSIDFTR